MTARLRKEDILTDFEIVCSNRSWKVHRTVLAMHSKVLLNACAGGLKVRRRSFMGRAPVHC